MPDSSVSKNNILIISENSSRASELSRQLAGKGYQPFTTPPFADLAYLDGGNTELIVNAGH